MIAFYLFGDFRFQPWLKIIVAVPFETCSWLKNKKSGSGVVRVTDGTESYKKVITLLLVAVHYHGFALPLESAQQRKNSRRFRLRILQLPQEKRLR